MEFELDKTYGIEFARLEEPELEFVRKHVGPYFPESVTVDEINIFEDLFRRKARQANTAFNALRESGQLGLRSHEAFALRGIASICEGPLADITRYREEKRQKAAERRKQAFALMDEEEPTTPDNVS